MHKDGSIRRQRRDLVVADSSCHLSTTHGGHFTLFLLASREAVNTDFYSFWFAPIGNRTQAYCFSSKHSYPLDLSPLVGFYSIIIHFIKLFYQKLPVFIYTVLGHELSDMWCIEFCQFNISLSQELLIN